MFFTLRHKVNDLAYVLASVFILSLKPRENSICCVSRWVRGEKTGVGVGGVALSVSLLLNVTGKIGKAFNVMQYLSNHPIKIRPNQSLPADWACTTLTPALLNLRTADVHHVHLQSQRVSGVFPSLCLSLYATMCFTAFLYKRRRVRVSLKFVAS